MKDFLSLFLDSSFIQEGIHSTAIICDWIKEREAVLEVSIRKITLEECTPWFYKKEKGIIQNPSGSFFSIGAIRKKVNDSFFVEQPILIQKEIGYLGILCSVINGILHFLMQAKIEPGNINTIQISPTIQATKSNFLQKHGGKRPQYLDYFLDAESENLIVDQIQSEQSSRFIGKRNRNVILFSNEYIDEFDGYKWMTLGQIKTFLHRDNLVNMDTRTVLSCIPWVLFLKGDNFFLKHLNNRLITTRICKPNLLEIVKIYQHINNYKMHDSPEIKLIPLNELKSWTFGSDEIIKNNGHSQFKVIFCDITIEGREVKHWNQPMFESLGKALFGLICTQVEGQLMILVKARPEIGCFDMIEIGPTIQMEYGENAEDLVEKHFMTLLLDDKNLNRKIMIDVIQSEEGGRFFHEQNRNVIIEVEKWSVPLSQGYYWCSFSTLNYLIQINNCLNIQLRNLLSLLEITNG